MLDVLIIGGGVVGTATARELARYDLKTVLLEKEAELGMGVTKANSGIVHAGYDCKPGTLKARFNVRGNELYSELAQDLGFLFRRNGALVLAFSEAELVRLEALKRQGETNGVPGLEIIFKEEILKKEPHIVPHVYAALYAPTSGLVFGPELAMVLGENAWRNGVEIHLETEVVNIQKQTGFYKVQTNKGEFHAKIIINGAGLYSDAISNLVGEKKYKITPRKGEYFLLDRLAKPFIERTVFQLPTERGKGVLILPTVHDNVLVGPSSEFVDDKDDLSTNAEVLDYIRSSIKKSVVDAPLHLTITTFTGLRAKEKDSEDFVIEELVDGFFNAVGIESPGLTAGPAIGEYLAELAAEKLGAGKNEGFMSQRHSMPLFHTLSLQEQNDLIELNPAYGNVVCRCEQITEGDVLNSIRAPFGAKTLDGLKFKSRAGSGRCQGGFCAPHLIDLLARERGIAVTDVTKRGGASYVLARPEGEGQ